LPFEAADVLFVPELVLAEVDYHLRKNRRAMYRLLDDIDRGAYILEPATREDLKRATEIDKKFSSLRLGLVDAGVIATAERLATPAILTTDRAFFNVRVGARWTQTLEVLGCA